MEVPRRQRRRLCPSTFGGIGLQDTIGAAGQLRKVPRDQHPYRIELVFTLKQVALFLAGLLAIGVVAVAAFLVSMRLKVRPVQDAVRRMNKAVMNPQAMKAAGEAGASASIIQHVGRTSGASYQTPIGAVESDDGFVVSLPYGTSPDWLKNVLAAGSATLVHEGHTYAVDEPRVVAGAEWNRYFSPQTQFTHRLFGVEDFLSLRVVDEGQPLDS